VPALLLVLASCGGPEKVPDSSLADTTTTQNTGQSVEAYFQVPLPGELFSTLKRLGVKARPGMLNAPENITKYTSSKQKALNFGVYSSDLFYASSFDQKADVLRYFNNLKSLGEDLGISTVVT